LKKLFAALGAAGALTIGGLAMGAPAFAGSSVQNVTMHCNPADPSCGINPVIEGPPPPFVTIPANCPAFLATDDWQVNFTGGNAVYHNTTNANGDWETGTSTGPATMTDGTTLEYTGQVTQWFGDGNNAGGQSYQTFTLHFVGSGPSGTIQINANGHTTTNNAGIPKANFNNGTVRC
jgi:hypothetical protein